MDNELLYAKIAALEVSAFSPQEVETMSQMLSPSTSRSYGLARVTRAWNISRAGVYRFRKASGSPRSSVVAAHRRVFGRRAGGAYPTTNRRIGLPRRGYRKIWARLRFAGFASPRRVRRVMGEHGLLAPHCTGRCNEKTARWNHHHRQDQ